MIKKISFQLKSGWKNIAKGTLLVNLAGGETEDSFRKRLLDIEMAVNAHTEQRLHLWEIEPEPVDN